MNRETYFLHLPHNQENFVDCLRSPANRMDYDSSEGTYFLPLIFRPCVAIECSGMTATRGKMAKICSLKYPARPMHSAVQFDHTKPKSQISIAEGTTTVMKDAVWIKDDVLLDG